MHADKSMPSLKKIFAATALATIAATPLDARTSGGPFGGYAAPQVGYVHAAVYEGHRYYGPPIRIACDPEKDGSRCEFRRGR